MRLKNSSFLMATIFLCSAFAHGAYAKDPITSTIIAKSGQVITGEKISTTSGPCIIVPENVKNVRIQNNQIGPCGSAVDDVGVRIDKDAFQVYIGGNTIRDVSSAVYAAHAKHPILVERNLVYDIRGPAPMGQMVKFYDVSGGGFRSRIFGNVSDKKLSVHPTHYTDHISIEASYGSEKNPIVIACNKIRGGDSPTGSGIMVGKGGGKWFSIRDNIIVLTPNTGIGIAGAERVTVLRNGIWNKGADKASQTENVVSVFSYDNNIPQFIQIKENQGIATSWLGDGSGELSRGLYTDKTARAINFFGNNWQHKMLKDDFMWAQSKDDCQ